MGELTGLLSSDLVSIKNLVSDNVSRDRGFRAVSEVGSMHSYIILAAPSIYFLAHCMHPTIQ